MPVSLCFANTGLLVFMELSYKVRGHCPVQWSWVRGRIETEPWRSMPISLWGSGHFQLSIAAWLYASGYISTSRGISLNWYFLTLAREFDSANWRWWPGISSQVVWIQVVHYPLIRSYSGCFRCKIWTSSQQLQSLPPLIPCATLTGDRETATLLVPSIAFYSLSESLQENRNHPTHFK